MKKVILSILLATFVSGSMLLSETPAFAAHKKNHKTAKTSKKKHHARKNNKPSAIRSRPTATPTQKSNSAPAAAPTTQPTPAPTTAVK